LCDEKSSAERTIEELPKGITAEVERETSICCKPRGETLEIGFYLMGGTI